MKLECVVINNLARVRGLLARIIDALTQGDTRPEAIAAIRKLDETLAQPVVLDLPPLVTLARTFYEQLVVREAYLDGMLIHHSVGLAAGRMASRLLPVIASRHPALRQELDLLGRRISTPVGEPLHPPPTVRKGKGRKRNTKPQQPAAAAQIEPLTLCNFLIERTPRMQEAADLLERYSPALKIRDASRFRAFLRLLQSIGALSEPLATLPGKLKG